MLTRIRLHSKIAIILLMLSFLIFNQCSKQQENNQQHAQQKEDPNVTAKPFKLQPGTGNWPSFRGEFASGVADGQDLPDIWNVQTGENILWKTPIPGLAHSSPVIWGDKIFVTTAISGQGKASFREGLYGDGDASDDKSVHEWKLYCINKNTGEIVWERLVTKGVPIDKRHVKATYANSTPATDGHYVVMLFGSEGLFTYDVAGNFIRKKELGRINCGAYNGRSFEWGSSSCPIIYKNLVIVQVDTQDEDFLIAIDLKTGQQVWKTERDELPSWGTPTIVETKERVQIVTNSSNFIYGYDPQTGKELWRLGGSSQITAPTPIYQDSLIIVCSGRGPEAPIFAIKTNASGTITLNESETSNEYVAWSKTRKGPYMPTPIIYRGYLYTINNDGRFRCYDFETGEQIYAERLPHRKSGFSASPVAADGKIYFPGEDGDIFVVKAGPVFEILATNDMEELLMASPALSDEKLFVKGQHHLFAIGK